MRLEASHIFSGRAELVIVVECGSGTEWSVKMFAR